MIGAVIRPTGGVLLAFEIASLFFRGCFNVFIQFGLSFTDYDDIFRSPKRCKSIDIDRCYRFGWWINWFGCVIGRSWQSLLFSSDSEKQNGTGGSRGGLRERFINIKNSGKSRRMIYRSS